MNKKIIILSMCIAILIITIGYSMFLSNIKINGTANITSTWNILFTDIKETYKTDGVIVKDNPKASGTLATFNVAFTKPGDKIVYQITVENKGSLNAIINKINATELGSDAIKFEISGIKEGDKLSHGESKTFNVTISYNGEIVDDPNLKDNELQIDITYIQDLEEKPEKEPDIVPTRLSQKILYDNKEQPDKDIDFSKISSDTNGKGLYYTNKNTEDNRVTYYFRGDVKNNYVFFGGYYWRIVRINEDGSIRLIYQGETANASGEDASIGTSAFNSRADDVAFVGYRYGVPTKDVGYWSTSYEQAHANEVDSDIKKYLEDWYEKNLLDYDNYLADTGFCNDRSLNGGGFGNESTHFNSWTRLRGASKNPIFTCPNSTHDLFTVKNSKGNQKSKYKIGLITADEAVYAGGVYDVENSSCFLYTGVHYWTITPFYFIPERSKAVGWLFLNLGDINSRLGVRPVINLIPTIEITDTKQDGSINNPYIIKM